MIRLILLLFTLGLPVSQIVPPAPQFDMTTVRADLFAGFAGDQSRFDRAMGYCERVLADNPRHPEALVWHGSGLLFQSGQAFRAGDMRKGGQLWEAGVSQMDDAVALAPDDIAVLIPRAATLLEATRTVPADAARPLVESAVRDYEHVLALQASYFATLGDHPKGELLFGLAEGHARLGHVDRARAYFERLLADAPGSGQVPRARQWLSTGALPAIDGLACMGCHQ